MSLAPGPAAAALIDAWEGVRDGNPATVNLDAYLDGGGVATIGKGHAVIDPRSGAMLHGPDGLRRAAEIYPHGLTLAQADQLRDQDLARHAAPIAGLMPASTTQNQFDALVSFAFNIGDGNFEHSSAWRFHEAGTPCGAPLPISAAPALWNRVRKKLLGDPKSVLEAFVAWSFDNGTPYLGLFCRRVAEYAVYAGVPVDQANALGRQVRDAIKAANLD